jgi:hypothetical protein
MFVDAVLWLGVCIIVMFVIAIGVLVCCSGVKTKTVLESSAPTDIRVERVESSTQLTKRTKRVEGHDTTHTVTTDPVTVKCLDLSTCHFISIAPPPQPKRQLSPTMNLFSCTKLKV